MPRELHYIPNARTMPHWRQCLSCNRVDGADSVLTPTRMQHAQFHSPDAAEGADERASHMAVWFCYL
jgi:hypothetical protein